MHRKKNIVVALILVLSAVTFMSKCKIDTKSNTTYDLQQIIDSDTIKAAMMYGSTSYFVYKGQDMGLEYEYVKDMADSIGVSIDIHSDYNIESMLQKLDKGEVDIIACNVPMTKEYKQKYTFCGRQVITKQVIIQRAISKRKRIGNVTELIGKEVYVSQKKHRDRMDNLNKELGGGIVIKEWNNDSITIEDLIEKVSKGEIEYLVCDDDLAKVNRTYYPNIDINLEVSFDSRSSWVVRKDCPLLAEFVDTWSKEYSKTIKEKAILKKYYETSKTVVHTPILSLREGKISIYDDIFKKYADTINWDWRLLASLAYSESNFNPDVVSWAGAKGLMQLMPKTAKAMGVEEGKESDPEESVKGAARLIKEISKRFSKITDLEERQKFVLAAYNAGIGHIYDAIALCKKYGGDENKWEGNVEKYMLLKSNEKYYSDEVCRNGYFRGVETNAFVREVTQRYKSYKNKIKH